MEKNEDVDMILNGHRSAHCGPFLPHLLKRVTEVWKRRCKIKGVVLRHCKNGWQRVSWAWSLEFGPFGRLEPSHSSGITQHLCRSVIRDPGVPGPHCGLRALSLAAVGSGWLLVVEAVIFRDFVCFWCHLNINQNNNLPKAWWVLD